MGRTILKYIYPWSVLHTFTIRWISTLDMTLVRSYHMGKFTSSYLQFSKNLASQNSLLRQSYLRHLSRFSENLTTLSLMVLHSVGLNDVKLSTVKKVDFKNTKCKFCEPRFKRM